jgi:hypothetical protein
MRSADVEEGQLPANGRTLRDLDPGVAGYDQERRDGNVRHRRFQRLDPSFTSPVRLVDGIDGCDERFRRVLALHVREGRSIELDSTLLQFDDRFAVVPRRVVPFVGRLIEQRSHRIEPPVADSITLV